MFLLWFESTFAQADEPVISKEDSDKVVKILNGFITGAAALMGMISSFITMFLYPGWVNGTLFGLQDYLKIMWILVSNIVYFIFAFILIAIAFMNIIGKGEWTWELKQAMPRFIIWVLIVPFSWFFVQFLLSLSAILTVWVLTLPYDSFQGNELFDKAMENEELAWKEICKDVIISFNGDFEWQPVEQLSTDANELDEHIKCKNGWKITVKELLTGTDADWNISADASGLQNSIFGVMSIYSYGILKVDELDTISAANLESVKTIADLIFKIVFDVLFIAVYLLLMVALLLALFVRGVRLWIYMMLSPAFWLLYFFWKWSEGFWESGDKFNIKEFIALALVPVYVSAALAFWLVFILVASEGIKETNDGEDVLKAWGFSLTILWAHGDQEAEKSVIWKLVVEIFGVVILWIAVMAALWASKTTKAIVEPIQAFWKSVWDLAAKAPTYAPIIPAPGWMQSAASLQKIWSTLQGNMSAEASKRASSFMGADSETTAVNSARERAMSNLNSNPWDFRLNWQGLQDVINSANWKADVLYNNRENREYLNRLQKEFITDESQRVDATASQNNFATAIDRLIAEFHHKGMSINLWNGVEASNRGDMSTFKQLKDALAAGTVSATAAAADTETTNNVNVQVDWDTVTVQEAIKRMGEDTRDWLEAKLDAQVDAGKITGQHKTAILVAFDAMDSDGDNTVDASAGSDN
jgi:hypothetical protein